MFSEVVELLPDIGIAILQTLLMVGISVGAALIIGTPIGIALYLTSPGNLLARPALNKSLGSVVNVVRSFPYIILLVALIPFTRFIVGTTIGPVAASVSLSVTAIAFFARLVEQSLRDIPRGIVEAAVAMGASTREIVLKVLLSEARPALVSSVTVTTISFISYSAVAGAVGGGGLGDLAIRYGYYRFETGVMIVCIILLVVMVQIIQLLGNFIARKVDKR
jgi:D-methionine transport system permease protein